MGKYPLIYNYSGIGNAAPTPPRVPAVVSVLVSFTPVRGRSPASASVRDQPGQAATDAGERPRTGVNETKTETTAGTRGGVGAALPIPL